MRTSRIISGVLFSALAIGSGPGCNKKPAIQDDAQPAVESGTSSRPEEAPTRNIAPAAPEPCGYATAEEVAAIVGPLSSPPRRGRQFDDHEQRPDGKACVYQLNIAGIGENLPTLSVEVRTDGPGHEVGFHLGDDIGRKLGRQLGWSSVANAEVDASSGGGWDYQNALPAEFFGRVGALGISVGVHGIRKPDWTAISKLAAFVRDRVPDRPMPSTSDHASRHPDPCQLLLAAEVEPVLGKLTVPPYRSEGDTPLALPRGEGCSYYTAGHHVLTIQPVWSTGKQVFAMWARLYGTAANATGQSADAAGPLVGAWDQAIVRADGALQLLKGDRILTFAYRATNMSREDAVKLADIAVQRLGS